MSDGIAVLGLGQWGEALALTLARRGHTVLGWTRDRDKAQAFQTIPHWAPWPNLKATCVLEEALTSASWAVIALPAQRLRAFVALHAASLQSLPLLLTCKGIEEESGLFPSEILRHENITSPLGFLAGPHLASEVAQGLPTAGTVAGTCPRWATTIAQSLDQPCFRVRTTPDLVGLELMGALKNVLAIVSGLAMGARWGQNARAGLLTVGLEEVRALCKALGGEADTFLTQGGIGDFLVSCMTQEARNSRFGMAWAQGQMPSPHHPLAEGFFTLQGVLKRAHTLTLKLPLLETLGRLLATPLLTPTPSFQRESLSQLLEHLT